MTRKSPVGSAAARKRYSLVVWLPASIMRYWPSRVRPTPRLKRSSSSWRTMVSSAVGAPRVWRKMWSWRLVVSSSVE